MNPLPSARSRSRSARLPPWFGGKGPDNEIVVSTRIRLARNLCDVPFPPHASPRERSRVFASVSDGLIACTGSDTFCTVNFLTLTPLNQRFLVERRIASPDLMGVEGDRGVAFGHDDGLSVMINEEDHLRLQCLQPGCNTNETWSLINDFDDLLGSELKYAFDARRGFLTCCPSNSGTGLRVSFLVHLPGLILTKSVDAVLLGASQLGIAVRGFFGEHSEVVGGYFQLSNHATMGASEAEFIASAEKTVRDIVESEKRARERLLKEARPELEDKIFRAFGILAYARTLSVSEFLNCASAIRLGIDTGLFAQVSRERLDTAMFEVLPAHLQMFARRELDAAALAAFRADRVRKLVCSRKNGSRSERNSRETRSGIEQAIRHSKR